MVAHRGILCRLLSEASNLNYRVILVHLILMKKISQFALEIKEDRSRQNNRHRTIFIEYQVIVISVSVALNKLMVLHCLKIQVFIR